MTSKKLVSILMVGTLSVTALAGCSKNKVRKIEGASDDVNSFIGVTEKVLDMKGVSETYSIDLDTKVNDMAVKATIDTTTVLDASGNISCTFGVKVNSDAFTIDGTIGGAYFVDNNMYVDFSGVVDIAKKALGEAVVGMYLEQFQIDDINKYLCFSIPTGDFKASDLKLNDMRKIVELINNDTAKALTDANAVTKDGDKYTVKMTKDNLPTVMKAMGEAFEANGGEIIDAALELVDNAKVTDKVVSMAEAIMGDVFDGMKTATGMELEKPDMSEAKTELSKAISELKDKKGDIVKMISTALKSGETSMPVDADAEINDVVMVYTDEKDGYTATMDLDSKATVEGAEAEVNAKCTITVKSTSDKVKAPENATALKEIVPEVYSIVGQVMGATSLDSYDEY